MSDRVRCSGSKIRKKSPVPDDGVNSIRRASISSLAGADAQDALSRNVVAHGTTNSSVSWELGRVDKKWNRVCGGRFQGRRARDSLQRVARQESIPETVSPSHVVSMLQQCPREGRLCGRNRKIRPRTR